ncbi:alpha/beta hydrolase [soil metagenome]
MDLPEIEGVRHHRVEARGVDFHIAEAGEGAPVVCLHGWPQNWFEWRHLLTDPPEGRRIIAPDLPGFGWSGPAPHRMSIDDIASDLLALLGEMGLERVLLVGHDWGGWLGYQLVLREPQRFRGYLALNIPHPWNDLSSLLPHGLSMLGYQPLIALFGGPLHRRTSFVPKILRLGCYDDAGFGEREIEIFSAPFRGAVGSRAARDIYRTFWRELPAMVREPEARRLEIPCRVLFGTADRALHKSLTAPERVLGDDFAVTYIPRCGHFSVDEMPKRVRRGLLELDDLTT